MMNPDPDLALIRVCQASSRGSADAPFRELYERYKTRVYNVCLRMTGNAHDALDASQEVFVILFRKIGGFRERSRFSSWVYRIATNVGIDHRRRARRARLRSLDELVETDSDQGEQALCGCTPCGSPIERAASGELEDAVGGALLRLSSALRATVVLRYTEGLSYGEISDALGVAVGTVKSRLHRAHRRLERELEPVLASRG